MIYAFLKGNAEDVDRFLKGEPVNVNVQTLDEHVDECLKALEELKYNRIWRYVARSLEEDYVEDHLRTILVLHDVGKIFYQSNLSFDRRKGLKYINFRGHEYFSTYLADEYLFLDADGLERLLVLSTILYHHHAMSLRDRRVEKLKVCRKEFRSMCDDVVSMLGKYGLKVSDFGKYLKDLENELVSNGDVLILNRSFVHDVYREVEFINKEIWDLFVRNKTFRRNMLGFTVIQLICDYRGSENRKKKPPKFYHVLKEFLELYQ